MGVGEGEEAGLERGEGGGLCLHPAFRAKHRMWVETDVVSVVSSEKQQQANKHNKQTHKQKPHTLFF